MRVVIQRVTDAKVEVAEKIVGQIGKGYLILQGVSVEDTEEDVEWLTKKIWSLRVFSDEEGKMNKSIKEVSGSILLISQFTLLAQTKKGNRPSYIKAARPEQAVPLYEQMISALRGEDIHVETGIFGADMKVSLTNDGPVTIVIDSKNRE